MKIKIGLLLIGVLVLNSCGTLRQEKKQGTVGVQREARLSPEQQRKYDYFFLEATKLKAKKEYDAAFDLLQHF